MIRKLLALECALLLFVLPAFAMQGATMQGIVNTSAPAAGGNTVVFDASASTQVFTTTSLSYTHTIGGGVTNGAVAVELIFGAAVTGVTVTVNGSSATLISGTTGADSNSSFHCMAYGIATGSTTGAVTIAAAWTTSATANAISSSFSVVNQTTPFQNGNVNGSGGFGANNTITITSATGDMTVDGADDTSGAPTSPTKTLITTVGVLGASRAAGAASNVHAWTTGGGYPLSFGFDVKHL
jgi:hypothetical protein